MPLAIVKAQIANALLKPVTIRYQNATLASVLLRLQSKSELLFAYDPELVNSIGPVSGTFTEVPLSDILQKLFFGTFLSYHMFGNQVIIVKRKIPSRTISGYLKDRESGEMLIGANIYVAGLKTGATTNQYGFYSLTLPEGNYRFIISHIGYRQLNRSIHLREDVNLDLELLPQSGDLKEITINTRSSGSSVTRNFAQDIQPEIIMGLPYYGGEEDVIKALQMQDGIKAVTEGSSGMFIRGGNADQNLVMLDEAMIYNPSHLFGLVSIFNPDAIKNVQVFKDYMPSSFGGRLSSVIDNRMADGNTKEFQAKGGVSLLSARMALEGPTVRNRGSFLVSFRRSLLDLMDYRFQLADHNSTYYDFNLKTNYQLNRNNRFFYSFYFGDDYLFSKNSYSNKWGNLTSTLRWNHVFNSQLFSNLSLIYSDYKNLLDVNADTLSEKYQWKTEVEDIGLKADFSYYPSRFNSVKFGISATSHHFTPGETTTAFPAEFNISRDKSFDFAAYGGQKITLRKLELHYGLRASFFRTEEDRNDVFDKNGNKIRAVENSNYLALEPRFNAALMFPSGQFSLTYNHNCQYVQLIQNSELAFASLETWMPASSSIKPQRSDHLAVCLDYLPSEEYETSASLYYKKLYNQYDLTDHTQIIQNPGIRSELRSGTSKAYGIEFNAEKKNGLIKGNLSYVYSRVFRNIKDINNDERFAANFDIPHEMKLTIRCDAVQNVSICSFFTYATGRPLTLPVGYYSHDNVQVPIYEGRNTSRYPDYYRGDISLRYHPSVRGLKSKFNWLLSTGIYNVFNRKNPLFYRMKQINGSSSASLTDYSSGILPWIAFNFKI